MVETMDEPAEPEVTSEHPASAPSESPARPAPQSPDAAAPDAPARKPRAAAKKARTAAPKAGTAAPKAATVAPRARADAGTPRKPSPATRSTSRSSGGASRSAAPAGVDAPTKEPAAETASRPTGGIIHDEGTFKTLDGFRIFYQSWRPSSKPKRLVILVHGFADHSGRFPHLVEALVRGGAVVYGYDQRGQGRSTGRRGHVKAFDELVDELGRFVRVAKEQAPGLETVIYGHSTGVVIALHYLFENADAVDRIVMSAPCLILAYEAPRWKVAMGNALAAVAPTVTLQAGFDPGLLSRDKAAVSANKADKLVSQAITTRYYREVYRSAMPRALAGIDDLQVPFLVIQGTADGLVNPRVAQEFEKRATITGRVVRYEGGFHELHNDTIRDRVFDDVQEWLDDPRAARR